MSSSRCENSVQPGLRGDLQPAEFLRAGWSWKSLLRSDAILLHAKNFLLGIPVKPSKNSGMSALRDHCLHCLLKINAVQTLHSTVVPVVFPHKTVHMPSGHFGQIERISAYKLTKYIEILFSLRYRVSWRSYRFLFSLLSDRQRRLDEWISFFCAIRVRDIQYSQKFWQTASGLYPWSSACLLGWSAVSRHPCTSFKERSADGSRFPPAVAHSQK